MERNTILNKFSRGSNDKQTGRTNVSVLLFFRFSLLVPLLGIQWGCPSIQQPKECVEFFNTNARQDEKVFAGFDLEKQLIIHRCGLDRHPTSDYSYQIAKRGKSIIPLLLRKLEEVSHKNSYDAEKTKYSIVEIFERLSEDGHLNNDETNIRILEEAVSGIESEWIRERANEAMANIKKNSGISSLRREE